MAPTRVPQSSAVRRGAGLAGALLTLSGILALVGVAFEAGAVQTGSTPCEL